MLCGAARCSQRIAPEGAHVDSPYPHAASARPGRPDPVVDMGRVGAMVTMTFDSVTDQLRSTPVVVTTASQGDQAGSVVGFHTQCGVDPVRYAVWLPAPGRTYDVARHATYIAVHVIDDSAMTIDEGSTAAGDLDADWFDRCSWRPGPGGVPLLATCPNHLVLRLVSARVEPGGLACLIGELDPAEREDDAAPPAVPRPDPAASLHDRLAAMDAETRRQFVNAAIGAGHAIDLSSVR